MSKAKVIKNETGFNNQIQINYENMQVLGHKAGCNHVQAYIISAYVLNSLAVNVTKSLFTALVGFCFKVGSREYDSSYVDMAVNERQSKVLIMECMQKALIAGSHKRAAKLKDA